jgi:hypothetical protein
LFREVGDCLFYFNSVQLFCPLWHLGGFLYGCGLRQSISLIVPNLSRPY